MNFEEKESQLQQAATLLKTKEDQVPQRIESLFTEMKSIQKKTNHYLPV